MPGNIDKNLVFMTITVNSVIEARLLFNFCTFGAVLYLRFCQFLLNKSPNFHDFFSLPFETVFYSKQSSIEEFTVSRSKYYIRQIISRDSNDLDFELHSIWISYK